MAPKLPLPLKVQDTLEPKPFWRAKPNLHEAMVIERRIVVTAKTDETPDTPAKHLLKVQAAGLVSAPLEAAWRLVREFETLPRVDDRFVEVKYFADRQRLFTHMAAYGFHAKMIMELRFGESAQAREIGFEVVEGHFVGMKGVIRLEDYRRQKTEISMTSQYVSATLPLPSVLMGVGLEVVGSRVAAAMREFIEEAHQKSMEPKE